MNINVEQQQFNAYFNSVNPGAGLKPNYDLALSWTNEGPTPYTIYYDMLDSKGNWNIEQYRNPAVDQALAEFASTTSVSAQKQALYKVEQIAGRISRSSRSLTANCGTSTTMRISRVGRRSRTSGSTRRLTHPRLLRLSWTTSSLCNNRLERPSAAKAGEGHRH